MTDRVKGFTVTLDRDIRTDDVEVIAQAISMIKGVIHVEPSITTMEDHINRERIKSEFRDKFYNFAKELLK